MTQPEPLTEQQLDEIGARATAATPGPWTVELEQCDCSDGLCGHGTYVSAVYANGGRRTDFTDFPDADWQFVIRAREAVPALLADLRRARDRVAELEVGLNDLAALVSQWYSRSKTAEATLDRARRITSRLANHAVGFQDVLDDSDRDPWAKTVGADIAELSAAVSPDAASEAATAPLAASQPSEAPVEGETGERAPTPLLDRAEHYLSVQHTHQARHDTLGANYGCAGCELRDAIRAQQAGEATATAEDFTGTQPCGHDDYHSPHPWHERPNVWCPGIGYDQAATEEATR